VLASSVLLATAIGQNTSAPNVRGVGGWRATPYDDGQYVYAMAL
jgi:hypothetical protein